MSQRRWQKAGPSGVFANPGKDKIVVMTLKQLVESKSAKGVGGLGGLFEDGKCPASLTAAPGQKKIYVPSTSDNKNMLVKAGASQHLELLFIVDVNSKQQVVPKGVAIVVSKQIVVKTEAVTCRIVEA